MQVAYELILIERWHAIFLLIHFFNCIILVFIVMYYNLLFRISFTLFGGSLCACLFLHYFLYSFFYVSFRCLHFFLLKFNLSNSLVIN